MAESLTEFVGDTAAEKVNNFLSAGKNAEDLLNAFKDADEAFKKQGDDTLHQMIVSKPLAGIDSLKKLAGAISKTLDDDGLLEALQKQFAIDWPNHSSEIHHAAAKQYLLCLEDALIVRCNHLRPDVFIMALWDLVG